MPLSIKAELRPHPGPCPGHREGPLEARVGASDGPPGLGPLPASGA